jgi:hypothetical protein
MAGEPRNVVDENVLRNAAIKNWLGPELGGGGHQAAKYKYVLEGGVEVLAKPESDDPEVQKKVRREEAAWIIASHIGCRPFVPITVQRAVPTPEGELNAAVMIYWDPPPSPPPPDLADLREEDVWRVACFDAVIAQTDRGGNWGLSQQGEEYRRPLLFDHGNAFGAGSVSSLFYEEKKQHVIPDDIIRDLRALHSLLPEIRISALLPPAEYESLSGRLDRLLTSGVLDVH